MAEIDRAGRYRRSSSGDFSVFHPQPLPPDPPIQLADDLPLLLEEANRALGRLDGSAQILPNPDLFVYMYVRKEAVLSSQIEGTQASLIDVLDFEAEGEDESEGQDVEEVVNYVHALNHGIERIAEEHISVDLINQIHQILLTSGRGAEKAPGKLRDRQNWIGPKGGIRNATFVPPPPEEVPRLMEELSAFIQTDRRLPILLLAGLAHVQFETIHPYLDGNGRTGRLLLTLLLCKRGVLSQPLLYISEYFKTHRLEYYDRLQAVRDNGDWEGWTRYFLKGVAHVADEAAATARKIITLREGHRALVVGGLERKSGLRMQFLEKLFFRPTITVKSVATMLDVSYQQANDLIQSFVELGLLVEITGQKRNRRFRYQPYLSLLSTEED